MDLPSWTISMHITKMWKHHCSPSEPVLHHPEQSSTACRVCRAPLGMEWIFFLTEWVAGIKRALTFLSKGTKMVSWAHWVLIQQHQVNISNAAIRKRSKERRCVAIMFPRARMTEAREVRGWADELPGLSQRPQIQLQSEQIPNFFPELIMVSLITDARLQLDILNIDKGEIKTLFLHVKPFWGHSMVLTLTLSGEEVDMVSRLKSRSKPHTWWKCL